MNEQEQAVNDDDLYESVCVDERGSRTRFLYEGKSYLCINDLLDAVGHSFSPNWVLLRERGEQRELEYNEIVDYIVDSFMDEAANPGAWAFNADVYCRDDAEAAIRTIIAEKGIHAAAEQDSNLFPQPLPISYETDTPDHCGRGALCKRAIAFDGGKVGAVLSGQSLTEDGERYVREMHTEQPSDVTRLWMQTFALDTQMDI